MKVTITPTLLQGSVTPPPSKSQAHRVMIAAALAEGVSTIQNIALSEDMKATLRCMEALGAGWEYHENRLTITGIGGQPFPKKQEELPLFDCGESGSTLRFFIPIALAVCGGGRFTGRGRLMQRPQKPYFELFDKKGISYRQADDILTIEGKLQPGTFALTGDVSSQFFTGLLFALPLLEKDSRIISTTALQSRDYVEMTIEAQALSGIRIKKDESAFSCPGGVPYQAFSHTVESDWSQAAFWYAAKALGSDLMIQGMNPDSAQGDRVCVDFLQKMSLPGEQVFDVSDCPDLVPPLAAAAVLRKPGDVTRIVGAARLRIKESDRLATVHEGLKKLGADITEYPEALRMTAVSQLEGGCTVDAANDHRIAMMTAIAATRAQVPVTIEGAECVAKSYPDFWEQYAALGGILRKEAEP